MQGRERVRRCGGELNHTMRRFNMDNEDTFSGKPCLVLRDVYRSKEENRSSKTYISRGPEPDATRARGG